MIKYRYVFFYSYRIEKIDNIKNGILNMPEGIGNGTFDATTESKIQGANDLEEMVERIQNYVHVKYLKLKEMNSEKAEKVCVLLQSLNLIECIKTEE